MADLQEALGGLSPPSLYAAFGSKEQLFMEAVELYTGQIRALAARAVAEAPTTRAKVEALLRSSVVATTEPGEPRGCLLVQGAIACSPSSDNVQRYLHGLRMKTHRTVTQCLKDGLAAGELPAGIDIAGLASFYTTLIHGLAIQARDGASRASMLATVERAMTTWDAFVAS